MKNVKNKNANIMERKFNFLKDKHINTIIQSQYTKNKQSRSAQKANECIFFSGQEYMKTSTPQKLVILD